MTSRLLRAELHAHTVYSPDGHITFDEMVRMLSRRRIDLVAITDHDAIADAIRALAGDEALRIERIQRGLQRGAEFLWERTARETLDVFKRVAVERTFAHAA